MTLAIPRTVVSQIISQAVSPVVASPRYAVVIGPDYAVRKYSDTNKANVLLGAYANADVAFGWPDRGAGEVVDYNFSRVFLESALLKYFTDAVGSGSTIVMVPGIKNQIRAATLVWAASDAAARSVAVPTDVKPGDHVRLTLGATVQDTFVRSLIPEVVAPVVAAPDSTGVTATSVAGAVTTKTVTAGGSTQIIDDESAAAYDGAAMGWTTDVYTIVVKTAAGAAGTLTVTSANGDNIDDVAANLLGPIAIGALGATVTFEAASVFTVGDTWTLAVTQGYTKPTAVSGGTFDGTIGGTYNVEVTRGGTVNGDVNTGALLTAALAGVTSPAFAPTIGTPTSIGGLGTTFTITAGTKLVLGDVWTVAVTPATDGPIRTLELDNNLVSALQVATDIKIEISIEKDIEVEANRTGHAPLTNWEQGPTEVTLKAGIISADERVMSGGALVELPVIGGVAYTTYRALKTVGAGSLGTVVPATTDVAAAVTAEFGTTDADAVLPFGVLCAAENSAGVEVRYIAVATDDLAGYTAALGAIAQTNPGWSLIPLSHDAAVQNLFRSSVNSRSAPVAAKWCVTWLGGLLAEEKAVLTADAVGDPLLATIADDPDTTGTQYILLTDDGGTFITDGVRAGDVVRGSYGSDGFGNATYAEFTVDSVLSNETLRLISGPGAAVTTAAKYEIWRPLSIAEQADAYATQYSVGDRRVRVVFPANPKRAGVAHPNYYLACSLAGLRSGVLVHQPLTRVQVIGWDDVTESSVTFADQLQGLMSRGIWVVTQDYGSAMVYTLRQVTTDVSDLRNLEDSIVSNVDAISETVLNNTAGLTGKGNLTDATLPRIGALLESTFLGLGVTTNDDLGPQVVSAEVVELRRHAVLRDRAYAKYRVTVPSPFNNLDIDLEIVV